jgi:signal transduction histidine kinase
MRTLIPNRIRFELSAPPEPLQITADEHQLTQLLMNLVLNARDAIGRQSGDIRVTLTALPERRSIEISVQDTGPGIPDATAEKIFEPLFTTKPNGTGLGLPVSQQIVERHGGEISLSSSEAGTTFRVVFPMEQ